MAPPNCFYRRVRIVRSSRATPGLSVWVMQPWDLKGPGPPVAGGCFPVPGKGVFSPGHSSSTAGFPASGLEWDAVYACAPTSSLALSVWRGTPSSGLAASGRPNTRLPLPLQLQSKLCIGQRTKT